MIVSWSTREASTINPLVEDLLLIRALHLRQFYLNPSVFITRAKKLSWRTMHILFSVFLIPHSAFTCLPHTHSHTFRGRSPSRRRICFLTWYPHCAGSRAIGHYSRCVTAEALPEVEKLMIHPVDEPCSPRFIHPSHRDPPSLQTLSPSRPVLQAPIGTTWEVVGFSGIGGDCGKPPPSRTPRPPKAPQFPSSHRIVQAAFPETQNIWDRRPPC